MGISSFNVIREFNFISVSNKHSLLHLKHIFSIKYSVFWCLVLSTTACEKAIVDARYSTAFYIVWCIDRLRFEQRQAKQPSICFTMFIFIHTVRIGPCERSSSWKKKKFYFFHRFLSNLLTFFLLFQSK